MPSFFSYFNNICLQCNAILFQQCPCGIHRIHTRCIFHRCKFLFPFYFIQQAVFLHMYHIQHQSFQLIAVRLFWLDGCCAIRCQASNFLECPMQRQAAIQRLTELIHSEQIIQDNTIPISQCAVCQYSSTHIIGHFKIFYD